VLNSDNTSISEDFCQHEELLTKHLLFVLDYNKKVNLTSIDNLSAGFLLHIEDSLSALPEVGQAPDGRMADIGSGGGFPGIPLAVVSGRSTTLIESIKKKAVALQEFVDKEHLSAQIAVTALRSEQVALQQPEVFAVVTARAVSELPILLELASPLLQTGGYLVTLKGQPTKDELVRGERAATIVGMQLVQQRQLLLSDGATKRTIITYEKSAAPQINLPRRPGMATKHPLA
jgi:16S rRNA (guanine527-N7)-methyltransferase